MLVKGLLVQLSNKRIRTSATRTCTLFLTTIDDDIFLLWIAVWVICRKKAKRKFSLSTDGRTSFKGHLSMLSDKLENGVLQILIHTIQWSSHVTQSDPKLPLTNDYIPLRELSNRTHSIYKF